MGKRLLLADDSITIQKVVGIIFANEDYELTVVDNGTAALEKAKQTSPDIMLIDALMPGMTGYEVCEQVRRIPGLQHVPLLLMTGAFEPFDEDKAKQSGADEFISKPFESQTLIEKVKKLIEVGQSRGSAAPPAAAVAPPAAVTAAEPLAGVAAAAIPTVAPQATIPQPQAQPPIETPALEVIDGGPDDDLWGTFELEEVSDGEVVEFNEVVELGTTAGADEQIDVEEAFSFKEEDEAGEVLAVSTPEDIGHATPWGPVGEEAFEFQDDTPPVAELKPVALASPPLAPAEPAGEDVADFFALVEEPVEAVATPPATASAAAEELQFAAEEKYVAVEPKEPVEAPVAETIAVAATAAAAVAVVEQPEAAPVAPAVPAELSEAQLTALVARISKDILEKIAWEVVPDLAESIIREEIRKIKEGA